MVCRLTRIRCLYILLTFATYYLIIQGISAFIIQMPFISTMKGMDKNPKVPFSNTRYLNALEF